MAEYTRPIETCFDFRGSKHIASALALAGSLSLAAVPAAAQTGQRQDSVGADAVDAVTQPLSDLGLRSKDIPFALIRAQQAPYDLTEMDQCSKLRAEVTELEEALGPDADSPQEGGGLINKGLQLGGNILGGFIPFRGLVRQVSGAAAEDARWQAATYAGVARRSYLKGYATARQCSVEEEAVAEERSGGILRSARNILGLGGTSGEEVAVEPDAAEPIAVEPVIVKRLEPMEVIDPSANLMSDEQSAPEPPSVTP